MEVVEKCYSSFELEKGISQKDPSFPQPPCYSPKISKKMATKILIINIVIDNNIFKSIIDIFERFNFTVREDDDLDIEVAVDPEMLGKVFENLIEEHVDLKHTESVPQV